MRSGRVGGPRRHRRSHASGSLPLAREERDDRVEQIRLLDRLRQVRRDPEPAALRGIVRPPADVSITIGVGGKAPVRLEALRRA